MTSVKDAMENRQRQEELQNLYLQVSGLKQVIHCALCAVCSEEIGEEDFGQDVEEHLCHKRCEDVTHD